MVEWSRDPDPKMVLVHCVEFQRIFQKCYEKYKTVMKKEVSAKVTAIGSRT